MTTFDPYYTWLGIPPDEQPPDHYRLLGIRRFENNPDVISNSADRQLAHLRTFQTGPRVNDCQRLLNEVAVAAACLADAARKGTYDTSIRAASQPVVQVPQPLPARRPQAAPAKSAFAILQIFLGGALGLFVAVMVLNYFWGIDLLGKSKKSKAAVAQVDQPKEQPPGVVRIPAKDTMPEAPKAAPPPDVPELKTEIPKEEAKSPLPQPSQIPERVPAPETPRAEKSNPATATVNGLLSTATIQPLKGTAFVDLVAGANVWPGDGQWIEIPPQLVGLMVWQNEHEYQGVSEFAVSAEGPVALGVRARDELDRLSPGDWKKDCRTLDQLKEEGWLPTGITLKMTHRGSDATWDVLVRNCKRGEKFSVRTDKYAAPVLLAAKSKESSAPKVKAPDIAKALPMRSIKPMEGTKYVKLVRGEHAWTGDGMWKDIPSELRGFMAWQNKDEWQGVSKFAVNSDGPVILAVRERADLNRLSEGEWKKDCRTIQQLASEGWLDTSLRLTMDQGGSHVQWTVLIRECKKGEQLSVRNDKYIAPVVIAKK